MNTPTRTTTRSRLYRFGLAFAVFSILTLGTGCDKDPIFSAIEKEVKLKDPTMEGFVNSVVEVDGNLYASNGYIYRRYSGSGSWSKISLPEYRCAGLAAYNTDLYALFQDSDWHFTSLRYYNGSTWTTITGLPGNVGLIGKGTGHIYAFAGDTNNEVFTAYTVTGGTATQLSTGLAKPVGSAGGYFATVNGVYTDAGTPVAPAFPLTTATYADIKAIEIQGANLYVLTSSAVYRLNGGAWSNVSHGVGGANGLSYLDRATTDILLISSGSGYGEVLINVDGSLGSAQNPGDSTDSSIQPEDQTQYDNSLDLYPLTGIFAVTGAVPATNDYVVYASVADYKFGGLWSYYPTTQPEWNRE